MSVKLLTVHQLKRRMHRLVSYIHYYWKSHVAAISVVVVIIIFFLFFFNRGGGSHPIEGSKYWGVLSGL